MFSNWSTQPILNSYVAVLLLTAGLTSLLWLAPAFQRVAGRRRTILVALRGVVIFLMLIAMLRPAHLRSTSKSQTAVLVVLLDMSRSMQLPNATEGQSRWEAQAEAIRSAQKALAALAEDLEVKVYAYDSQLKSLTLDNGVLSLPERADGDQTDIGGALYEAMRRELGKRLAGVILLGDGSQTAFDPQLEVMEAGRELQRADYPLWTIAFGPSGDAAQSRDIAVENLPEQYTVFVKNELLVRAQLRVRGFVNKEIPVELVVTDSRGTPRNVATRQVRTDRDGEQLQLEVPYVPPEPGQYKLTLRVPQQPGELVAKNNELSAFLTVLEGGLNVALLVGAYRLEERAIERSINDSPDIQVDVFDARDYGVRDRWPVQLADNWLDPGVDAYILGEFDAAALGETQLTALREAVAKGKGLIVLGGNQSFGPGGYKGTPLEEVLPIRLARFEKQDLDKPQRTDVFWEDDPADPNDLRAIPVVPHPITTLAAADKNEAMWRRLPELKNRIHKFTGISETPGVRVLLETPNQAPVLVAGDYVRGRVLAFAGDSTYRWRSQGFEAQHKRFWRQVILWLVRREDLEQHDVWVKLPQRRFNPGSRVPFTAGAKSATGDPLPAAILKVELTGPDGKQRPLDLADTGDERSGAIEALKDPGDYLLVVTATNEGKPIGMARAAFQVLDQDIELGNPAADPDQLTRLANLTAEAGGKAIAAEELPALLQKIKQKPPELEMQLQTKWQLADTWWDAWLFFLCVVGLLTGEWVLRKRWGLV